MKLLFDQIPSHRLPPLLSDLFPGSANVRLLDLDADFTELAQLRGPPPKVIWPRCRNQPTRSIADLLRRHAAAIRASGTDPEAACLEIY